MPRLRELLSLPRTRTAAAEAIWQIAGDPEPLFAVVRETVAAGSPEGIDTLGGVGAAAAPLVGDVAAALDHEFRWTRATAATALGKIGGPEASEALTRRLDVERDPKAVEAIRKALAEIRE